MLALISQKIIEDQNRELDALDHNYTKYLEKFKLELIPVSNIRNNQDFYHSLPIERIILSGGEDIGESKQRDETERRLLDFAINRKIPVLGICRGMQFINFYFGGGLIKSIKNEIGTNINHVAANHLVEITNNKLAEILGNEIYVNSYHNQGINSVNLASGLKDFAQTKEGVIEGIYHPNLPIAGIQWHPERENQYNEANDKILNSFLNQTLFWKK